MAYEAGVYAISGPVKKIGLTGSIATGKSTVTAILREEGFTVICADELARRVVEPGRVAFFEIVEEFGDEVVGSDGALDRKKLGAKVFSDRAARKRLEEIVHPQVSKEALFELEKAAKLKPDMPVIYDVPLLYEIGAEGDFDLVVVVHTEQKLQLERLMARDGLGREEALRRIATQMDIDEKAARADLVIYNTGTIAELEREAAKLAQAIKKPD